MKADGKVRYFGESASDAYNYNGFLCDPWFTFGFSAKNMITSEKKSSKACISKK